MTTLFGNSWALALCPIIFGAAITLLVLARRPGRAVGIGAGLFALFCGLISVGLLGDAYKDAERDRIFAACAAKNGVRRCTNKVAVFSETPGFIGNESPATEPETK